MKTNALYTELKQSIDPLDVRLLLCHVLGYTHEEFLLQQEKDINPTQEKIIRELAAQRAQGRPVAKIIGYKEFYGRNFITTEATLDPRPDSETLIDAILSHMPDDRTLRILDLGTGTGCLMLTLLAERPLVRGVAVDKSPEALAIAQKNAQVLGLEERVTFHHGDWAQGIDGPFDIVISNPPYIPTAEIAALARDVKEYDPGAALDGGADGLEAYRVLIADAPRLLRPNGVVGFEVGQGQAQAVTALLQEKGFGDVACFKDLAGIERVLLAKMAKTA